MWLYEKYKKTLLYAFILLIKENIYTFEAIYNHLSIKYNFNTRMIMVDFNMAQIQAITNVFKNTQIHGYFSHFSQAKLHPFRKEDLCKKGSYEKNSELLFNL